MAFSNSQIMRRCGQLRILYEDAIGSPYFVSQGLRSPALKIQYRDGVQNTIGWGRKQKALSDEFSTPHNSAALRSLLATPLLRHFIVYHDPEIMGYSATSKPAEKILTKKPVDGLIGHRIWLLTGEGHPCQFFLVSTFIVHEIGHVGTSALPNTASGKCSQVFDPPVLMNEESWFDAFRKYNGNFAFGLHEITHKPEFVRQLQQLRKLAENQAEEAMVRSILAKQIPKTAKQALIQARIGQGLFRENLMKIEKFCRVTRVANPEHLIASHCKPWRDCLTDEERLDGNNGLLLCPNVDHLFDSGVISFTDAGNLLISKWADKESLKKLGIETKKTVNVGTFHPKQQRFLAHHRQYVFERR